MYKVSHGETISDVAINACGSVSAISDILDLNGFTDWSPVLLVGQQLLTPAIVNASIQKIMQHYPANNGNVLLNISDIESILESAIISDFTPYSTPSTFINYYTVRYGENLSDVCLNATGDLTNLPNILDANGFTDWNTPLNVGQQIIIPNDSNIQPNVLYSTQQYPANSGLGVPNVDTLIIEILNNWMSEGLLLEDGGDLILENNGVLLLE